MGGRTATCNFHVSKFNPNWDVNLRIWSEAGVVKEGTDGKFGDHGVKMMFIGCLANRESDSV